jgi:hypothetical protein
MDPELDPGGPKHIRIRIRNTDVNPALESAYIIRIPATPLDCMSVCVQECGGTTHVLRLNWSPDGQYIVTAHAMNGGGPTAKVTSLTKTGVVDPDMVFSFAEPASDRNPCFYKIGKTCQKFFLNVLI